MEKIFDAIKEKLESPFLSNYFIGILIFNRKVIYAALSIDYNDKIDGFYIYGNEKFTNKIELLDCIYWDEEWFCYFPANIYLWPVIYAIVITGGLPYIKSVFKTISENADVYYERVRVKWNKMKVVSKETHDTLMASYKEVLEKVDKIDADGINLIAKNSEMKNSMNVKEIENKKLEDDKNKLNGEISNNKLTIEKLENDLRDNQPSISIVFKGIWKFEYQFHSTSTNSGIEYFKILNGYEYYISDKPDGVYRLRCYIDRYQFMKDGINRNNKIYDRIRFKKSCFNTQGQFDENEYSFCDFRIDGDRVDGEEIYTDDKGKTEQIVSVVITKYSDF